MENTLGITWTKDPNGKTIGNFKDSNGQFCTISKASWTNDGRIFIATAAGALILTPEMCAELGLILGYVAFTEGELPEPSAD